MEVNSYNRTFINISHNEVPKMMNIIPLKLRKFFKSYICVYIYQRITITIIQNGQIKHFGSYCTTSILEINYVSKLYYDIIIIIITMTLVFMYLPNDQNNVASSFLPLFQRTILKYYVNTIITRNNQNVYDLYYFKIPVIWCQGVHTKYGITAVYVL